MCLTEIIKNKIKTEGPISFRDFMEMSLYYPNEGYYTSVLDKIGISGDYYTSPVISSVFGEMIGKQIEEMWKRMGEEEFTIVEFGAGTGVLCRDILKQLSTNKELYGKINYCIIEKSASLKQKQKELLKEKVSWHECIHELSGITGCILSNEVVDNFAVHRVIMKDELMEVFVDCENDFTELLRPAGEELNSYLAANNIVLTPGHQAEINLQALDWISTIASSLKKGFVLTIDYGYRSSELYSAARNKGTLTCYHKHVPNNSPYQNIGKQDITAHVNFSALNEYGTRNGLTHAGYTDQSLFLRCLGLVNYLRRVEEQEKGNKQKLIEIHTLLNTMGSKFKVLMQQKGIDTPLLSGMMLSESLL
jgi:SAM-dependent MidA family methyltransferase